MLGLKYLKNVTTLRLDNSLCDGCAVCTLVCPHAVFTLENKHAKITNPDACMECGACANNCPEEALTVKSGVGCAYGIILGRLRGTERSCDCGDNTSCCQ
jgi:NAD-dependent dihydropyrimidine dehydrogenase PreA subunit